MSGLIEHFHWLRPLWLLALLPVLLLLLLLWRRQSLARSWQQLVSPALLPYLVDGASVKARRWPLLGLGAAWVLATLALAGPTWEQRSSPVHLNDNALVIILDLSPSMLAEDISPSRLVRARLKVADVLRTRTEGQTALVVYAGDAHVVAPLTDDTNTITNLLSALHPSLMPLPGSNTEAAVELALELMAAGNAQRGELLLITDGIADSAARSLRQLLAQSPYRLAILGVGTDAGAPIPSGQSGFVRNRNNEVVIARLGTDGLQQLARQLGGRYQSITPDSTDLNALLSDNSSDTDSRTLERQFDQWYDRGPWLVWLLLPIALYCFRRGVLLAALLCAPLLTLYPGTSQARPWQELLLNRDQQAQRDLERGEAERAAERFRDPQWRATAHYRAGNHAAAADAFAALEGATNHYNRGNALARAGQLEQALEAYDQALAERPDWEDAQFNRNLVERLLEQQQGDGEDGNDGEPGDDGGDPGDGQDSNQREDGDNAQGDQDTHQDQTQDAPQEPSDNGDQAQDGDPEPEPQEPESGDTDTETEPSLDAQEPVPDLSEEERQALEQWLRRVPDDPGGLLRRKFEYQHQQQRQQRLRGQWPESTDEERW